MTKSFFAATFLIAALTVGCSDSPTGPSPAPNPAPIPPPTRQVQPAENPPETPTENPNPPGENPPVDPPTENPPAPAPAPPVPPGTTEPAPGPEGPPTGASCHGLGKLNKGETGWTIQNVAPYECTWTVVTFLMKVPHLEPGWDDQDFAGWGSSITLQPGQSGNFSAYIPACKPEEQLIQIDIYAATKEQLGPNAENGHPRNLKIVNEDAILTKVPACSTLPPPPNCEAVSLKVDELVRATIQNDDGSLAIYTVELSWNGDGAVEVDRGNGTLPLTLPQGTPGAILTFPRGSEDRTYTVTFTYKGSSESVCKVTRQAFVPKKPTPPPPPPCAEVNPPDYFATGTIVQTGNKKDDLRVTVNYRYSNLQNEKIGIFWIGKNGDQWVKKSEVMNALCGAGKQEKTLVWTSYDHAHLLDGDKVQYWAIRYKGSDPGSLNSPNIIEKKRLFPSASF